MHNNSYYFISVTTKRTLLEYTFTSNNDLFASQCMPRCVLKYVSKLLHNFSSRTLAVDGRVVFSLESIHLLDERRRIFSRVILYYVRLTHEYHILL